MKTCRINTANAAYQKFEVLKTNRNKRYRYNEFFVEGVRNINEAVNNGWHICSFLYTAEKPLSDWAKDLLVSVRTDANYELSRSLMERLSSKEDTSELLAVVRMMEDDLSALHFSNNPIIALFDRPSNRGNLGTVIRSCDASGIEALIITGHAVDLYDPEVIASSMGSFFNVQVVRVSDNNRILEFIGMMKERYSDFKTVGTTAHKKLPIYECDLTTPLLFMIGNETDGLCRMLTDNSDALATIPMSDNSSASSYNAACAATVMFYEAVRQRNK